MIGTGTPLLNGISAEGISPPGIAGVDLHQTNESKPAGGSLTAQLEDILDLAGGAERRHADLSYKPVSGRGDSGDVDLNLLQEQLKQIREQLNFLQELLPDASNPEQRRILGRGLQENGAALEKIGRQLAGHPSAEPVGVSGEFVSLVKGFRQIVQEVEKMLADENRIPAPLLRVIKDLTSESLSSGRRARVNELA